MTRAELRQTIPGRYSFLVHFGWVHLQAAVPAVLAVSLLERPTATEWLILPGAFLFANLFEYVVHRYPMHRLVPGLSILFRRHTLQHHQYFTDQAMAADDLRDMRFVLFPAWAFPLFVVFALPAYALVHLVLSASACGLFVMTTVGYYLLYEWLHMLYHLWPGALRGHARFPFFTRIREHHRVHHDPSKMLRHNFNITFPIFDSVLGTTYHDSSPRSGRADRP